MRITRVVTGLIAAFMAAMVALTISPAASNAVTPSANTTVSADVAAKAKPLHHFKNVRWAKVRGRTFAIAGTVTTARAPKVAIVGKKGKNGTYKRVALTRAGTGGKFKKRFNVKCGHYYGVRVGTSKTRRQTTISVFKIRCY
ncbi:MAG: hypothetical protein L0H31_13045 [Nocardioidaceae bacterium]|nr:hypothetical protein [Nocardioidaceae bacterium]